MKAIAISIKFFFSFLVADEFVVHLFTVKLRKNENKIWSQKLTCTYRFVLIRYCDAMIAIIVDIHVMFTNIQLLTKNAFSAVLVFDMTFDELSSLFTSIR